MKSHFFQHDLLFAYNPKFKCAIWIVYCSICYIYNNHAIIIYTSFSIGAIQYKIKYYFKTENQTVNCGISTSILVVNEN